MWTEIFFLGIFLLAFDSAGCATSSTEKNVTSMSPVNITVTPATFGRQATFKCTAENLYGQKTFPQVSWVRHRDVNLLAVGKFVYIRDHRFKVLHEPNSDDWFLLIKGVDYKDEGIYECQINTVPYMSHKFKLEIFEPTTEMLGESTLYVDHNSSLNLTCIIHSPNPPAYVFWKKDSELVEVTEDGQNHKSGSSSRKVVITFVKNISPGITSSSLWIDKVNSKQDSGTYACIPSNSKAKEIVVHVLKDDSKPAAIHTTSSKSHRIESTSSYSLLFVRSSLLLFFIIRI